MDSEKYHEIQELAKRGRPHSDEGPFYHHSFWESYKGSVKGKLGGLAIGLLIGAVVGAVSSMLLGFAGIEIAGLAASTIIGGSAAAGAIYGAHEFGEVGRVTGAVAAAGKDAEKRMQIFEKGKFEEIKQDISELKEMVSGKKPETIKTSASAGASANSTDADEEMKKIEQKLQDYRVHHHDKTIPKADGNSVIFGKVALVGMIVGAGIGLLLSGIGLGSGLENLGLHTLFENPTASALTMGLAGASFGINRDAFRKIFDKTDTLFKGMFDLGIGKEEQLETGKMVSASKEKPLEKPLKTLVYHNSGIDYPVSETHHQDKVLANARQALASMDHSTASRH